MVFTPILSGSGFAGFQYLTRTREEQTERLAASTQTRQQVEEFTSKLGSIETPADLMDNPMMLRVALGAFGLDEDFGNRAFIQRVLEADLSDSSSLPNRLADKRYLAFAQAFNFSGEDGPQLEGFTNESVISDELAALRSPDDLMGNSSLLRAALETFGLEADINNTYLVREVLLSDPRDPNSFANRLDNPAYAQMSEAFGFSQLDRLQDSIYGFASLFNDRISEFEDPNDLLLEPRLIDSALKTFGMEELSGQTDFLRNILTSDTRDAASFVNQLGDERYVAFSRAFGFGDPDPAPDPDTGLVTRPPSIAQEFVETVFARDEPIADKDAFFEDFRLLLDTMDFFNVPSGREATAFLNRLLDGDPTDPNALMNRISDKRYVALASALPLELQGETQRFPPGFAEEITERYLARQFEIKVGEQDPTLRIAISFERELGQAAEQGLSNNARWFNIMASRPLREVFETVFNLPQSFGTLDIDRQLSDLKDRAQSFFGTNEVTELLVPEKANEIRDRFLFQSGIGGSQQAFPSSPALTLLSGAGRLF